MNYAPARRERITTHVSRINISTSYSNSGWRKGIHPSPCLLIHTCPGSHPNSLTYLELDCSAVAEIDGAGGAEQWTIRTHWWEWRGEEIKVNTTRQQWTIRTHWWEPLPTNSGRLGLACAICGNPNSLSGR